MSELVARASTAMRLAGVVVGLAAVGLTLWAVLVSGVSGLGVIPFLTGWMALAAVAALRVSIRANHAGLAVTTLLRVRLYSWERVRGFRAVDRRGLAGVYVLLDEDDLVRLPLEDLGGWGGKRRRRELARRLREARQEFGQTP